MTVWKKKISSLRNHCCFKTVRILMRFIGDFQRESCRKRLPLYMSTAAWLAQQKSDSLLSGRSRFQTPARTNTQGLKELGRKFCLCNDICKRLDLSSRIRMKNRGPRLTTLSHTTNSIVKETTHCSWRVRDLVPCVMVYSYSHFH